MNFKEECQNFVRMLKPYILKSLPFILILMLGFQLGQQDEANRITQDCKYAKAFRAWSTAYQCVRII